jgi:Fe-S-cluster-containing hydrogenase component 2
MNRTLKLVYFSPTDSTKNILHRIANEMGFPFDREFNLTNYEYNNFEHTFEENDFILLGFPVYGGRVPKAAKNRFIGLKGNKSKIAIVLTYGDMHYDDSLIEINEIIKNNGFNIIGMGAFVSRHSVVENIGFNRPNEKDYECLKIFGKRLVEKIYKNENKNIEIKLEKTLEEYRSIPIKPKGNKKCLKCELCIKLCPENAIDNINTRITNKKKCICCMRCIKYCPNKARNLSNMEYFVSKLFLKIMKRIKYNKENKSEIMV